MLLCRGPVPAAALSALHSDERFATFRVGELTGETLILARRLSGLILATTGDPFALLVYAASASPRVPIIIAVERRYASERYELLRAGASACTALPFRRRDLDELVPILTTGVITASVDVRSGLLLDALTQQVRFQDRTVQLTPREFAVLHRLVSAQGLPVSANDLLSTVWNDQEADEGRRRLVEVYVHHLRRKLEKVGAPRPIRTVRGYGYALTHDFATMELSA